MIIPIGFTFVQLPNEKPPSDIWPQFKWQDISDSYPGIFFRVVGGEADEFGKTQTDNSPHITRLYRSRTFGNNRDYPQNDPNQPVCNGGNYECDIEMPKSGKSDWIWLSNDGSYTISSWLRLESSGGEVRPKNMAIRVWKRIQ